MAPALPMASVPTGMPPGICAMESSESSPLRAFDSTGTPRTGRTVFEAVMPGKMRGAAGSRDDDLDAALLGGGRVFEQQVGRAVSGDDLRFMWNTEIGERLGGVLHGFPVG